MTAKPIERESAIPLFDQVGELLREDLANGTFPPGSKLPPEPDLARVYGVSRVTIRTALAQAQKQGLILRRKGKGTFAAQPGRRNGFAQPAQWLAVLIEMDIAHPAVSYFWLRVTQMVRRCLAERGAKTRLYVGHSLPMQTPPPGVTTCDEFMPDIAAGHVRGLMTIGMPHSTELDALVRQYDVTWVDVGTMGRQPVVDYERLIDQGVQHLAQAGCQRLAWLTYSGHDIPDRAASFAYALIKRHLPVFPEWIVGAWPETAIPDGVAAFHRIWQGRDEKPDALLITDEALYRDIEPVVLFNRIAVPRDLMIATHWNKGDPRRAHLSISRLEVDTDRVAAEAAELLLARLADPHAQPPVRPVDIHVVRDDIGAWKCELSLVPGGRGSAEDSRRTVTKKGLG